MKPEDVREINRDRLESWQQVLNEANATPMVLVAASHGEQEGTLHVCVPNGVNPKLIVNALLLAAQRYADETGLAAIINPMPWAE